MTRKQPNFLTMQERIQILDWLRANHATLPTMYTHEIAETVASAISHPCTVSQIRGIAKAANVPWNVKKYMPSKTSGQRGRMDKLEARIKELEIWCYTTADGLGIQPPDKPVDLPNDDDL